MDIGKDLEKAYNDGYEQGRLDAVKHGKWENFFVHWHDTHTDEHWDEIYYSCSECDWDSDCKYTHCPQCGARMDGE